MHDVAMVMLEAVLLWAMYIHRKYGDGVGGGGKDRNNCHYCTQ